MRKALVVGIDYYQHASPLIGCVNDAINVENILNRHADGSVNFSVKSLKATNVSSSIDKAFLKESVRELFSDDSDLDVALFYFAGHGYIESTGGYLCASDSQSGDEGLDLKDIKLFADKSPARHKIIILDSCHSGIMGSKPEAQPVTELREGITILTASTHQQYSEEEYGEGVFTSLLVDALNGTACNLLGDVTPGSIYAHIDQALGPWEQRPVFKTNVKSFVSLRKAQAPISLSYLQRMTDLFPEPGFEYNLDPSFEPKSDPRHEENEEKFYVLQCYNRVNLVQPIDAHHMYDAAMCNKSCKLTTLGEHYRRLVEKGQI